MFEAIKNRDAWSTIRGFVYQVDITILRWLALKDNEILELEKGEDIDIVNQDISKGELSRELEQIKYRESNLTLNNDDILDCIINFYVHTKNNAKSKLFFRFVTNATYGVERPALSIKGKSGIETWIELNKTNPLKSSDKRLKKIRKHLLSKVKENLINLGPVDPVLPINKIRQQYLDWHDFLVIGSDVEFKDFAISFEWSLKNDDYVQISQTIKDKLLEYNAIDDVMKVDEIYARLFLYVFKLLCKSESKTLSKQDFDVQIEMPQLDAKDNSVFEFLKNILSKIEIRVKVLEDNFANLAEEVSNLPKLDAVFNHNIENVSINIPSLINNGSLREEKINSILEHFKTKSWVALQGINGTGKTQLASLTCRKFESHLWLDLRPYIKESGKVSIIIETFLKSISGFAILHNRVEWIDKVSSSISPNSVVVFNDLPDTRDDITLKNLLINISNSFSITGIKLLTTSNFSIHREIRESLNGDLFFEESDLGFSDSEIIEYFTKNQAPQSIINSLNLIIAITSRNPRLISAMLNHLKAIQWGNDYGEILEILFKKEFTQTILEDAQLSIKRYISDEKVKELLYRLSLINWSFNFDIVKGICEVKEVITHPNDKFAELKNIWIQVFDGSNYQISPLIYNIGIDNLNKDVLKNTHLSIGHTILASKRLNKINASQAINHFRNGEDYNNAGKVLYLVLDSTNSIEEYNTLKDWGYLYYWNSFDAMPEEMDLMLRTNIRTKQFQIHEILGNDTTFYKEQILYYSKNANLTNGEILVINLSLIFIDKDHDLTNYWNYCKNVITAFVNIDKELKLEFVVKKEDIINLLWIHVLQINKTDEIRNWFETIDYAEKLLGINFFENEMAQSAITIISKNIIKSINGKDDNPENWQSIIDQLEFLNSYFKK